MSIDFHFCKHFKNPPLNKEVKPNKECVEKVVDAFSFEEATVLKNQNILIFFNDSFIQNPDEFGFMIKKNSLEYEDFKKRFSDEIKVIPNFSDFIYIVYLSKNIGGSSEEIFKYLMIAHELQHVLQDIYFKYIINKDFLLKKFLKLKELCSNQLYRRMPIEFDAFTKAKKISFRICNKKVDNFLKEKIVDIRSKLDKTHYPNAIVTLSNYESYWENIREIDIKKSYDLESEFNSLWNEYEDEIKNEVYRLNKKKLIRKLEEMEKYFLDAYFFYSKKCKK